MKKDILKTIGKCILFGVMWFVVLGIIAMIVSSIKGYIVKDILFIEGIVFLMIGLFASIGGNPVGLSLQTIGQDITLINANLEAKRIESEKTASISKNTVSNSVGNASFIIAGILSIAVNFII